MLLKHKQNFLKFLARPHLFELYYFQQLTDDTHQHPFHQLIIQKSQILDLVLKPPSRLEDHSLYLRFHCSKRFQSCSPSHRV